MTSLKYIQGLGFGIWGLGFRVGGFPKLGGTILGVPIIRTIKYWGLYSGPPILGNYRIISGLGFGTSGFAV